MPTVTNPQPLATEPMNLATELYSSPHVEAPPEDDGKETVGSMGVSGSTARYERGSKKGLPSETRTAGVFLGWGWSHGR